jgi:KDO2-lipid IV(A) lauroyltransferase
MTRRRRIAQRNIERCFPEWNAEQCRKILSGSFYCLARAFFETAWSWSAPKKRIVRWGQLEGVEHLEEASANGRGVLVVTLHSTSLELGARLIASEVSNPHRLTAGFYRPLKNKVIEWYQNQGRLKYCSGMISKRDIRSAVRQLRKGLILWYAPDQDFGAEQSLFVPFFGIETASVLATQKLARMADCAVVPMFPYYDKKRKAYVCRVLPALENFPSDDQRADLLRINQITEAFIRSAPEQYWWIHRRFKTRPKGDPPFYS